MLKKAAKIFLILILLIIGISLISFGASYIEATQKDTYIACGCGCCGGEEPIEECLYQNQGDDLNEIIRNDLLLKKSPTCNVAGCSQGILYKYCD